MKNQVYALLLIGLLIQGCSGSGGSGKDIGNNGGVFGGNNSGSNGADANGETPAMRAATEKCRNLPEGSTVISYHYSENHNGNACTTGCQIFYSTASYCSGLKNDALNNDCAKSSRDESFEQLCR